MQSVHITRFGRLFEMPENVTDLKMHDSQMFNDLQSGGSRNYSREGSKNAKKRPGPKNEISQKKVKKGNEINQLKKCENVAVD